MKSQIKKIVLLFVGCSFLVVAFQNCGQAGSVTENATDFSKVTDPLVVDVVNEIENQEVIQIVADDSMAPVVKRDEGKKNPVVPVVPIVKEDPVVIEEPIVKEDVVVKEEPVVKEEVIVKEDDTVVIPEVNDDTPVVIVDDSTDNETPVIPETPIDQVLEDYSCDDGKKSNEKKVLVCHFPKGNPANRHEICISKNALKAHESHGHSSPDHQDHLGKCVAGQ